MNEKEFTSGLNRVMHGYYPHEIYLPLKSYGIKHITTKSMKVVLTCIMLDYIGVPITVEIVSAIIDSRKSNLSTVMARLGDKNVLELKGYSGRRLIYKVNSDFKKMHRLNFSSVDKFIKEMNESV